MRTHTRHSGPTALATALAMFMTTGVLAATATEIPAGELTVAQLADIVRAQARELQAQRDLIAKQEATLGALQAAMVNPVPVPVGEPGLPQVASMDSPAVTAEETAERSAEQADDDPLLGYDPESFPGSLPIPGTSAAMRVGGYVTAKVVQSFEALGSSDRFIVGSIPVDPDIRGDAEASLTANQSRLNFDLRENFPYGQFRAFIEADFVGAGDTFRLRHAFGQFRQLLAGQTWSTFMDTESSPEEVDFEGINGRLNSRRTQLRYFPSIGREWDLAVSIEDPKVTIGDGEGLSQIPDVVASIKRQVRVPLIDRTWHLKGAALVRNLRARPDSDPSLKESASGWGLSLSGRTPVTYWNEQDSLMMQVNYGSAYSSYVSDLQSIELPDASFNPVTGELETLTAFAWYAAFQHWWKDRLRSNLVISRVKVDNDSFAAADAYDSTWRVTGNLIWSPIARMNVGAELLWGQRENFDGASGNATQFQFALKYIF